MPFSLLFSEFQIPRHQVEVRTSRSSGPGGQNVNKVETKVEIRFHLDHAYWIPPEVKERMKMRFQSRVTKEGEFVISSNESRSQHQNLEACFEKLRSFIGQCWQPPKKRIKTKATRSSKEKRIQSKKRIGQKKKLRTWNSSSDE